MMWKLLLVNYVGCVFISQMCLLVATLASSTDPAGDKENSGQVSFPRPQLLSAVAAPGVMSVSKFPHILGGPNQLLN